MHVDSATCRLLENERLLCANQAGGENPDHRLVADSGDSIRGGIPELPLRIFRVAIGTEGRRFDHAGPWIETVGERRRGVARQGVVAGQDDVEHHAHARESASLPPDTRVPLLAQPLNAREPRLDAMSEEINFGWHKPFIVRQAGTSRGTLHKLYNHDGGLRAGNGGR